MMHQFNRTMEYLESKLDAEVDLQKFQQLSGYSYALFSRLFSILADMTLAEYLRNRRLSEAVTDLREIPWCDSLRSSKWKTLSRLS